MSILEEYVIHHSVCSMPRCEYVENDIEIDCDDCQKKMIEEHDKQIRAEVIEEIKKYIRLKTKYADDPKEDYILAHDIYEWLYGQLKENK